MKFRVKLFCLTVVTLVIAIIGSSCATSKSVVVTEGELRTTIQSTQVIDSAKMQETSALDTFAQTSKNEEVLVTTSDELGDTQNNTKPSTFQRSTETTKAKGVSMPTPIPKTVYKPIATPTPVPTPVPTVAPTVTPMPVATGEYSRSFADAVLRIVNDQRSKKLVMDASLRASAEVRAKEIATHFSHTRPDGRGPFTAINISYRAAAENIACGQTSPQAVMSSWNGSSGHHANIMDERFTKIGIACYVLNGVYYWVQVFVG